MSWRRGALVVGCLALVLSVPFAGFGQSKGSAKTVSATLKFGNEGGDKIWGDSDTIAASISGSGRLTMNDNEQTGRHVHVLFGGPMVTPPSPNCWVWGKPPSYDMSMPADLEDPNPLAVQITTWWEFAYTGGSWKPVLEQQPNGTTEHYMNMLTLPKGATAYVQVLIRLWVNSTNDIYDVNLNRAWNAGVNWNGGIFAVQADSNNKGAAGDRYYFRQLDGVTTPPPPYLDPHVADLRVVDNSDGSKDLSGNCTLGNFSMPFSMTVTRK
jgi:hypothetical protein